MKIFYPVMHIGAIPYKIRSFDNIALLGPPIIKLRYLSPMKIIYITVKSDKLSFDMKIPYKLVRTVLDDIYNNMNKQSTDVKVKLDMAPYNKIYVNMSYDNLLNLLRVFKKDYIIQPQYIMDDKDVTIDQLIAKL